MKTIGFCGLPNAGKSTFLKLLTNTEILIANYPFSTKSPKLAKGYFFSANLLKLHSITKTNELMPAYLNFLDVPGLIRGSHQGLGLGNEFLSYLRQADYVLEIVRNFKREDVSHSEGNIDPERDILLIEEEIIQSERKIIEENLLKLKRDQSRKEKLEILNFLLNNLQPFKRFPEFKENLKDYNLLLTKEWFLVFNGELIIDISKFKNLCFKNIYQLDFQLELELQNNQEFQNEFESKLNDFLDNLRRDLNLIEVFTFNNKITQSWLIENNSLIINFADLVHSDFAKKFKYGEVINLKDLSSESSWQFLKNKGLVKQVGKDYLLRDNDIIKIII
ncbi:MAG: ribosome-binding ATPase YchF [Candidatus Parcubacteria bacterium]|nr:MAG: ribosome-binding ATPase YchF [Candidatus Parcubacteria bacterium]